MNYDPEQINELIRNRRSVYPAQYTGEHIDDEIIAEILENANWAPTHKLTEPWRFKVFTQGGLKRLFLEMSEIYKSTTPPEQFKQDKFDKFSVLPGQLSHAIAICMKRDEKESVPEIEEICAVACAVQNMALSVSAYGLGGYWSTGNGAFTPQMKDFLQLGEKDRCLGFFFIGKVARPSGPGRRRPIEEKVEWID